MSFRGRRSARRCDGYREPVRRLGHSTASLVLALGVVCAPIAQIVSRGGAVASAQEALEVAVCGPPGQPLILEPDAPMGSDALHTYRFEPFRVPEEGGPYELAVGYTWAPVELARLEIGLWDPDGTDSPAGFRGWSGSREGRIHEQQAPISISPYGASRGYVPGEVEAGVWNLEIGVAELPTDGQLATYRIEITCTPESAYTGPERVCGRLGAGGS